MRLCKDHIQVLLLLFAKDIYQWHIGHFKAAKATLISPLSMRSSVLHESISETTSKCFLKLVMKLGDNKDKKIVEAFFRKILILPKFGHMCQNIAILAQNSSFWDFAKKRIQQIF